jgi:hypothetical protein
MRTRSQFSALLIAIIALLLTAAPLQAATCAMNCVATSAQHRPLDDQPHGHAKPMGMSAHCSMNMADGRDALPHLGVTMCFRHCDVTMTGAGFSPDTRTDSELRRPAGLSVDVVSSAVFISPSAEHLRGRGEAAASPPLFKKALAIHFRV